MKSSDKIQSRYTIKINRFDELLRYLKPED